MDRNRFVITDAQWAKMEPHCPGKKTDPGRTGVDTRLFMEAVLWIARTDSPCGICIGNSGTGTASFNASVVG